VLERLRYKRTTERGSKQRLRTIKRRKPGREGKSGWGVQGQRKAIRGNRTRQRQT